MQNTELNLVYKWIKITLIVGSVVLGLGGLILLKNLRNITPAYNSVTVSGEGETVGVPNVATFSFSVSADAATVALAQSAVTNKMNPILKELKDLGIEERDIQTSDYSVYPKYRYETAASPAIYPPIPGRQVQDGYTASHSVTVKVSDTDLAGKAIQVAGDNGATNLSGLSFTIDDPDKLVEEARKEAIEDATSKAKELAKQLGVRLVRVVSYSDGYGGMPMPYAREALGMGGDIKVANQVAPTLPTGENKVRIVVSVTYEIR